MPYLSGVALVVGYHDTGSALVRGGIRRGRRDVDVYRLIYILVVIILILVALLLLAPLL
jgi:hypothetical protein